MLIGPFTQLLTMDRLPSSGPIQDQELDIIPQGGLVVEKGKIVQIGPFDTLKNHHPIYYLDHPAVALPGFIDAHTHICYAGSRALDYAARLQGKKYHEIAAAGGGILDTVRHTREATLEQLESLMLERLNKMLTWGVTTCEIKSGYGLTIYEELKMLRSIKNVSVKHPIRIIPTCLAAHAVPLEFGHGSDYLHMLLNELLPVVKKEQLSQRVDIFVDDCAFSTYEAFYYLKSAQELGFTTLLHADQFARGGSALAGEIHALSADHLEHSGPKEFESLKAGGVIPIILPGSSLGLGTPFAPARQILDAQLPLVIASDWNPGSAPMGNLLIAAALLGAAQHLSNAETFAALTCRAAKALSLEDVGILKPGFQADFLIFPSHDYREILYQQGRLTPEKIFIRGEKIDG